MKKTMGRVAIAAFATMAQASIVPSGAAQAGEAKGVWLRDNGEAKVRIASCGSALCGTVIWEKDADKQNRLGMKVFFDMVSSGEDSWAGKAFNPDDGKTYTGKMTLSGNTLTTAGCVLAGLICRSVSWTRQ